MKAKLIGVLIVAVLPMLAFVGIASAQTFRSGSTTNVASGETIDGSVYIAGSTVDVAGTVNGDLFCAGQNITISGRIDGDVLCAAQTITLSGTVSGDVRLAAQTVAISGSVDGSASAAGQAVTLEGKGKIGRDAQLLGQSATVNGQIGRDVLIGSMSATIGSNVGRNVSATVESLTLANGAVIGGTVDYTSPQKLTMNSGAQVAGKVTYTEQKIDQKRDVATFGFAGALLWAAMLVASAILFVLVFPHQLHRTTNASVTTPSNALLAMLVGLIAGIVMPFAIVLVMITVLGIPFALIALIGWLLILALSGAFAAYYLGRVVWQQQTNAVLIMLVGAVIIVILLMIPLINALVWLLAVWYGSGAILLQLRQHVVAPNYDMKKSRARR